MKFISCPGFIPISSLLLVNKKVLVSNVVPFLLTVPKYSFLFVDSGATYVNFSCQKLGIKNIGLESVKTPVLDSAGSFNNG